MLKPSGRPLLDAPHARGMTAEIVMAALIARQFNTRLPLGLSSEKAGTSISKRSPVSLTIW